MGGALLSRPYCFWATLHTSSIKQAFFWGPLPKPMGLCEPTSQRSSKRMLLCLTRGLRLLRPHVPALTVVTGKVDGVYNGQDLCTFTGDIRVNVAMTILQTSASHRDPPAWTKKGACEHPSPMISLQQPATACPYCGALPCQKKTPSRTPGTAGSMLGQWLQNVPPEVIPASTWFPSLERLATVDGQ